MTEEYKNNEIYKIDLSKYGLSKTFKSKYVAISTPIVINYTLKSLSYIQLLISISLFCLFFIVTQKLVNDLIFYRGDILQFKENFLYEMLLTTFSLYIALIYLRGSISNFVVTILEGGKCLYIDKFGMIDRRVSKETIPWNDVSDIELLKRPPFGVVGVKLILKTDFVAYRFFRAERLFSPLFSIRRKRAVLIGLQHLELKPNVLTELLSEIIRRSKSEEAPVKYQPTES